jgi:hypothetical protein
MKRLPHTIFFLLVLLVILTPAVMAAAPELARHVVVLHNDVESPGAIGLEIARQVGGGQSDGKIESD